MPQKTNEEILQDLIEAVDSKSQVVRLKKVRDPDQLRNVGAYLKQKYSEYRVEYSYPIKIGNEYSGTIHFSNWIFKEEVTFKSCAFKGDVHFSGATFSSKTSFEEATFFKKARFIGATFEKSVNFDNASFKDLVDFYRATFKSPQQFFRTDFSSVAVFSNTRFLDQVQFKYLKFSSETYMIFESAEFHQALDISRANFIHKVRFWEVEVKEPIVPDQLWLYATDEIDDNNQIKNNEEILALKRVRESYRRIKQEFRGESNLIEALPFQKYEMIAYRRELRKEGFWHRWRDKIVLFFNRISNDYGLSWARGVCFTVIVTAIFWGMAIITCVCVPYKSVIESISGWELLQYYVYFLNVSKWRFEKIDFQQAPWLYFILFVGRIFIGYGYYQTISAFRKFGKN